MSMQTSHAARHDREILEQCIVRLAHGDTSAMEELYHKTSAAVYGFVLAIVKNAHDAEDILQDTYIRIHAAAGTYRPQGSPMPWIFAVARNLALMRLRAGARTESVAELPELPDERGLSPEERIVLSEVLHSLDESERQIVMLKAAAGFKHREIAQMLGLSLPAVLSKYNRAVKRLRVQMEGE